ncbi:hypothetical protein NM688_g5772 [Phlebia brevispora]|uniref:Uncharacterized protein n=1 Tax=Phlebia brevispora TaxID=194682 RepID=A0ACC1SQB2_9APHY|nr:hypothetical protein NM688_g5772 [Phlebia brevispora]
MQATQKHAMHRCLSIEEILRIIFAHVRSNGLEWAEVTRRLRQGRPLTLEGLSRLEFRTVLSLALTCRTFKEPALDLLWKEQWGLRNLIALLPRDLWAMSTVNGRIDMDFRRAPVATDWTRFDHYARRVKWLHLTPPPRELDIPVSIPSSRLLNALRSRGTPILPNLEGLEWSNGVVPADSCNDFTMFLGPSIKHFTLYTDGDETGQSTGRSFDVSEIPSLCPEVNVLEIIKDEDRSGNAIAQISTTVSSLRKLVSFSCHTFVPIPRDMFIALGIQSQLTDLNLIVGSDEDHPNVELLACSASPRRPGNVLESAEPPSRSRIATVLRSRSKSYELTRTAIAHCHSLLGRYVTRVIEYSYGDYDEANNGPSRIFLGFDDILPLKKFKGLRELSIGCPFNLDDKDLQTIATWWPTLEELSLGGAGWFNSQVTLNSLVALARGCPNLNELELSFDPSQPAIFRAPQVPNYQLTRLGVADSPVSESPEAVAARLTTIFPNLETIDVNTWEQDSPWEVDWDEVQHNLPNFTP